MYNVLLVDDEPLILSGIKFLVDWEKNDCAIVGTARNGQQALEEIRQLSPQIVICDINMPLMSGIELMRLAADEAPTVVFIMLTNHQEFALAREALRFHAVDYLLKNQLDPDSLLRSLDSAKTESDKRAKLRLTNMNEEYREAGRLELISETLLRLIQKAPGGHLGDIAALLLQNDFSPSYCMLYIPIDFSQSAPVQENRSGEISRLFSWQVEVTEKLCQSFFKNRSMFPPDSLNNCLMLVVWGVNPDSWETKLNNFIERLLSTSSNITKANISVLSTSLFQETDELETCRSQLFMLRDYYYLTGVRDLGFAKMPNTEYSSLGLSGLAQRLSMELLAKNLSSCMTLMDKAIVGVQQTPHRKSQAEWLCSELYDAACGAALRLKEDLYDSQPFFRREDGYEAIDLLFTRSHVTLWLTRLKNEIAVLLEQLSSERNDLAERAREYVQENVYKRIMLQDVANHVCISPGYLSATFKKAFGQNLVDYINQCKMEEAQRLIKSGEHRIGEIAYMLSFENAYYFTKVFRRHTGMTPTEYQRKMKG